MCNVRFEKGRNVAIGIVVLRGNAFLLQLRDFKKGIDSPGQWGFFGGLVEENESPEKALLRELREELSFFPDSISFFREFYHPSKHLLIHVYNCYSACAIESMILKEGEDFGVFCAEEVITGTLFSRKLGCKFPLTKFSATIFSIFYNEYYHSHLIQKSLYKELV